MRIARRFLFAMAAILPMMTALSISPSQATSSSLAPWYHYFSGLWSLGVASNPPPVPFTEGLSYLGQGPAWTAAADAAIASWNVLDSRFQYADAGGQGPENSFNPPCFADPTKMPVNQLHSGSAGGFLAVTNVCTVNARVTGFQMVVDPGVNWYTSASTAAGGPSSSQYDMQSTLTHEFGHGAGWWGGHFQDCTSGSFTGSPPACTGTVTAEPADICGTTVDRGTMCAVSYSGRTELRTLSDNDKVPWYGAYPKEPVPGGGLPQFCNPFGTANTSPSSLDGATTSGNPVIC